MRPLRHKDGHFDYGDYLSWPAGERWELLDGRAWACTGGEPEMAPPRRHQQVLTALTAMLWQYFQGRSGQVYASPFEVRLTDAQDQVQAVVQPDLCVVTQLARLDERGAIGAPEWVLEVVSPLTVAHDFIRKLALYERHQVSEYWIVHPGDETIQAYSLNESGSYARPAVYSQGDTAHCQRFPGLHLDLKQLFANS